MFLELTTFMSYNRCINYNKSDENLQGLYKFNRDVEVWNTNRSVTQLFVL